MCPPYYFDIKDVGSNIEVETDDISSQVNDSHYNRANIISITVNAEDFNPDVKKHEGVRGVEISIFLILVQ